VRGSRFHLGAYYRKDPEFPKSKTRQLGGFICLVFCYD